MLLLAPFAFVKESLDWLSSVIKGILLKVVSALANCKERDTSNLLSLTGLKSKKSLIG
tara:strand:+ start:73 stop:246 length:174 start_codon:yes stop_codon:yes gene_type:complete